MRLERGKSKGNKTRVYQILAHNSAGQRQIAGRVHFTIASLPHALIIFGQVYKDQVKELVRCSIYLIGAALLIYCPEKC